MHSRCFLQENGIDIKFFCATFCIFPNMANEFLEHKLNSNRRQFLGKLSLGVGTIALGSLLAPDLFKKEGVENDKLPLGLAHFAPKAKRVIYLFQNGAPSQLESFDYKPKLRELHGEDLPDSYRQGQRLTGMTSGQDRFPLVGAKTNFKTIWAIRGVGK